MSIETVFFDMDGVLINSISIKQSHRQEFLENDLELDVQATDLIGLNTSDKYDYLQRYTDINISKSEFQQRLDEDMDSVYEEHVSLLSGFRSNVAKLHERSIDVGLVTASNQHRMNLVLDRFDIKNIIDVALSADVVDGPSKPAPDLYEAAIESIDVSPNHCVAIEDSRHGAKAATQAGVYCIGYQSPEHPAIDLPSADEQATSPTELWKRLFEIDENYSHKS